jgi:hypothetical protein
MIPRLPAGWPGLLLALGVACGPDARADGNNDAKRVTDLQVEGTSRLEAFDIYWPLFFPASAGVVTLSARGPHSGRVRSINVPLVSYQGRLSVVEAARTASAAKDQPLWEFRLLARGKR